MTVYHPTAAGSCEFIGVASARPIWRKLFTKFAEWLLPPRA